MTAEDRDDADGTGSDAGEGTPAAGTSDDGAALCWHCGAELPEGAMFCGECGSAVGTRAAHPAEETAADAGEQADDAEATPVEDANESGLPPHGDALLQIPAVLGTPAGGGEEPARRVADEDGPTPSADEDEDDDDESGLPPHGDALLDPDAASAWSADGPDADEPDGGGAPADPDGGDSAPTAVQPVLGEEDGAPRAPDPVGTGFATELREPPDDDSSDPLAPLTPEERFAAERLLDPDSRADKFVLQFSTGESATVYGSGLVGRNPVAEPGEYVDHFVVIRDPGRSVSKTHLEFGQDGGTFWVLDRFSGNGSVLREPEGAPKRCEPGRRYAVARGTRVEIGDQFFVVS
jgi:hypothetical protein